MTMLRNIWADLVEKRLWPVAALLLAGLVAVPMAISKGSGDGAPPPSAPSPAIAAAAAASRDGAAPVTLDTQVQVRRHDGRGRDPFVQPKAAKGTEPDAPTLPSSPSGGGSAPDGKPQTTGPATAKPAPAPVARAAPRYVVDLRFGQADSMKTLRDIGRLTPLPSASSPFFVFIGVKDGGRTAVFLVSSDAKATGDGKCRPSSKACETIELKAGDTEFFDLTTDDGAGLEQYQMDIVKIHTTGGSGSGKAARSARAKAKASKADRRLLRKVVAGRSAHLMGSYRWVARRGVLVHVPAWADERSSRTLDGPPEGTPSFGTSAD